eukprot:scaffold158364_cov63-Attheya_sp.AAC.1
MLRCYCRSTYRYGLLLRRSRGPMGHQKGSLTPLRLCISVSTLRTKRAATNTNNTSTSNYKNHDSYFNLYILWKRFTSDWNATLVRQPKAMVATFMAAQSTSWLLLYGSLSMAGVGLPPAAAAGWACARLTRRLRRPLNVVLAAAVHRVLPQLGDLRVSPLVTGVASDAKTAAALTKMRHELELLWPAITKPVFWNLERGWQWIQGPVDTYGLALYLSGKASFLITMGGATIAIGRGVDVEALLVSWGVGEALGDTVATIAGSSAANVVFVPVHFLTAVYGVQILEKWDSSSRRQHPFSVAHDFENNQQQKKEQRKTANNSEEEKN